MLYIIKAHVRQSGAIGIFYPHEFKVECRRNALRSDIFDAWHEQHGDSWELNHLISYAPDPDEAGKRFARAVGEFMEREGLNCLTTYSEDNPAYSGPDPYFSWRPCECCNQIAGNRYDCQGFNPTTGEIQGPYAVCEDCIMFHANGDTPATYQLPGEG